jgi:imidazolonepropionase-like amidohydrolase
MQEDRLGQIREGFVADLLILNANMLEDIIILDWNEQSILGIVKDGRVIISCWEKPKADA